MVVVRRLSIPVNCHNAHTRNSFLLQSCKQKWTNANIISFFFVVSVVSTAPACCNIEFFILLFCWVRTKIIINRHINCRHQHIGVIARTQSIRWDTVVANVNWYQKLIKVLCRNMELEFWIVFRCFGRNFKVNDGAKRRKPRCRKRMMFVPLNNSFHSTVPMWVPTNRYWLCLVLVWMWKMRSKSRNRMKKNRIHIHSHHH